MSILSSIKKSDIKKQYQTLPSLSEYLPWLEWSDVHNMMLLEDGFSVGSGLEIRDIGCEATTEDVIERLYSDLTGIFSRALPLHSQNPWVMQIFVQDDITLSPYYDKVKSYIKSENPDNDPFIKEFLEVQKKHFELMVREEGVYLDPKNDLPFKGRIRRIRILFYRRYDAKARKSKIDVIKEHNEVSKQFLSNIKQTGIRARVMRGKHFYEWLIKWFNPKPSDYKSSEELALNMPYPDGKPYNWSFTKDIFFGNVKSSGKHWLFDDMHHNLLMFRELTSKIKEVGIISREINHGASGARYSLLDKLPQGSIYTMQIIFESKIALENQLDSIEKAAIGKGQIIQKILSNTERARDELADGHMLMRTTEGVYIRAKNLEELEDSERMIKAMMQANNLSMYDSREEIYPLDNYLRLLPFNFNFEFDKDYGRSNYKYAKDIAKLLPVYGRGRGDDQNPLYFYYNRGGEPFIFDPYNNKFKQSNSHQLLLGSSGAGKSVQLNDFIMRLSAIHNPHIIALEVGGSFDLTAMYLKEHGRSVKSIKYEKSKPYPQNPFAEAFKALDKIEREEKELNIDVNSVIEGSADKIFNEYSNLNKPASDLESEIDDDRDILNEMLLATRIAITGGDPKEEEGVDRIDLSYINKNLITSAKRVRDAGRPQMIMSDVKEGFELLAEVEENQAIKDRLLGFTKKIDLYISDSTRSAFINRVSKPIGIHDLLHIDFGFLQEDTYKDLLNMVCITLISKVLSMAEKNKSSGRFTVLIADEFHVFSKCAPIMLLLLLAAKVGRKYGLWLVLSTQNVKDLNTEECRKLLTIIETWICFALVKAEIQLVSELKTLSSEIMVQLESTMQEKPLYTEGVLIGAKYSGLFRCVPPRMALSLALTEQSERAERAKTMREQNISELEAVKVIAEKLENTKVKITDDEGFPDE